MIISASYRTDIPAFYSEWLSQRIKQGFAEVKNPYNNKIHKISLALQDSSAYLFWTRNATPASHIFAHLHNHKIPFAISWTLTAYPRTIEPALPSQDSIIASMHKIANQYGKYCIIWRYDPIIISSLTPAAFHLKHFTALCQRLKGVSNEVITSFCHYYKKSHRQLAAITTKDSSFHYHDPEPQTKIALLQNLQSIAAQYGMRLSLCSQPQLTNESLPAARCIDTQRLSLIKDRLIKAPIAGNRIGCHCAKASDIGSYDTCPHGCRYCYANNSQATAKKNFKKHQQNSYHL